MEYKVIAVDLDGTLLSQDKKVSKENIEAINMALNAGKHVILSTGRGWGETEHIAKLFPKMRYALTVSGAYIFDLETGEDIRHAYVNSDKLKEVLTYIKDKDIEPLFHCDKRAILNRTYFEKLAHYKMEEFYNHYLNTCDIVDDVYEVLVKKDYKIEKLCMYHESTYARNVTGEYVRNNISGICVTNSESTSLEVSDVDSDKGSGLLVLSQKLGIPIEEFIAVGDGENDLTMLEKAGLPLVMGNATDYVKSFGKEVLPDNENNGVAFAIKKYLL